MKTAIATRNRLDYARGYLELGLVDEASDELEAIVGAACLSVEVLEVRMGLYVQTKQWDRVITTAASVCAAKPKATAVWIAWARALRELQRVSDACNILLIAEIRHGVSSARFNYDLARYYCLLGDFGESRRRLMAACRLDSRLMNEVFRDPDLSTLWGMCS